MAAKTNRYCVCVDEEGAPREISRSGEVVTYKAIDYRTGNRVALQVIPSANVDATARRQFEEQVQAARKLEHINIGQVYEVREEDGHLVFASEFLQGETAEHWLLRHGPMPVDAVLRIGLQVVNALTDATFHHLTHRAIQPSNLLILPGASPDGGWPFVKLMNFGLAGLRLYGASTSELIPTIAPQFASPEQEENGRLDFRSEVFSLGATMCFLLTGAVPLLGRPNRMGVSERVLPKSKAIPRSLRKLLRQMLRTDREERPPDPHSLSEQMRALLQKVERRARPVPLPVASRPDSSVLPVMEPLPLLENRPRNPWVPALAVLALLSVLAAATIYPDKIKALVYRNEPIASMGVPIGVPDNTPAPVKAAPAENRIAIPPIALAANSPTTKIAEAPAQEQPEETVAPAVEALPTPVAVEASAAAGSDRPADFSPPAEGPSPAQPAPTPLKNFGEQTSWARLAKENQETNKPSNAPESGASPIAPPDVPPAEKAVASNSAEKITPKKMTEARAKNARVVSTKTRRRLPSMRVGTEAAEFLGTNREGNWVLRLRSGETVVTPPVPNPLNAPVERHGPVRRVKVPPRALPVDDSPVVVLPPDG